MERLWPSFHVLIYLSCYKAGTVLCRVHIFLRVLLRIGFSDLKCETRVNYPLRVWRERESFRAGEGRTEACMDYTLGKV